MYIEPNTIIKFLQNVPLDTTYKDTIYFSSASNQTAFFNTKVKYTLTRQSYQRKERGYMRVQLKAEDLYNCNYLMFQNTSFGSKWFYAFITSVEYVSNDVSEVGFEIDVMQTWFFDVTMLDSYIEREHSRTDGVGDNIIAEPLTVSDMFNGGRIRSTHFNSYSIILVCPYKRVTTTIGTTIWTSPTVLDLPVLPPTIDHQKQGLFYTVLHTEEDVARAIMELTDDGGKIEDVVCLYPVPYSFVSSYNSFEVLSGDTPPVESTYYTVKPTTLGTYTPRNKKLLTYPYNKLVIDNGTGGLNEFAFEYFSTETITFKIYGNLLQNTAFKAFPCNYKNQATNYSLPTLLNDFPLTSYSVDAFNAWFAQNKTSVAFQSASSIGSTVAGVGFGEDLMGIGEANMLSGSRNIFNQGVREYSRGESIRENSVSGGANSLANITNDLIVRNQAPMDVRGTTDGCLEIRTGHKDFNAVHYYLNPSDARMFDDFFSMYGYATKRVKKPNRNVREHWTYVKTIDCNVIANAPANDVRKICSIYDNGITFWRNGNEVGEYLDSSGRFKENAPST